MILVEHSPCGLFQYSIWQELEDCTGKLYEHTKIS